MKRPVNMMLLAMCIAMFIVLASWPPPDGIENPKPAEPPQKEKPHKNPLIAFWRWTTHEAVAFYTAALFLATGGLGAVAIVQIRYLANADRLARQSLTARHRAWIRRRRIRIAVPLMFAANGAAMTAVKFDVENSGNAPALHVRMRAWLLTVANGIVPNEEARAHFDRFRTEALAHGFTLFPGESFPHSVGFDISQTIRLDAQAIGRIAAGAGRYIPLYVAGCIDYTFPSDLGERHQTSFLMELEKRDGSPISVNDGTIDPNNLRLRDTGFGGGYHAD